MYLYQLLLGFPSIYTRTQEYSGHLPARGNNRTRHSLGPFIQSLFDIVARRITLYRDKNKSIHESVPWQPGPHQLILFLLKWLGKEKSGNAVRSSLSLCVWSLLLLVTKRRIVLIEDLFWNECLCSMWIKQTSARHYQWWKWTMKIFKKDSYLFWSSLPGPSGEEACPWAKLNDRPWVSLARAK